MMGQRDLWTLEAVLNRSQSLPHKRWRRNDRSAYRLPQRSTTRGACSWEVGSLCLRHFRKCRALSKIFQGSRSLMVAGTQEFGLGLWSFLNCYGEWI